MLEHSDLLVLSISLLKNILAVNGGEFKMDKFLKLFKETPDYKDILENESEKHSAFLHSMIFCGLSLVDLSSLFYISNLKELFASIFSIVLLLILLSISKSFLSKVILPIYIIMFMLMVVFTPYIGHPFFGLLADNHSPQAFYDDFSKGLYQYSIGNYNGALSQYKKIKTTVPEDETLNFYFWYMDAALRANNLELYRQLSEEIIIKIQNPTSEESQFLHKYIPISNLVVAHNERDFEKILDELSRYQGANEEIFTLFELFLQTSVNKSDKQNDIVEALLLQLPNCEDNFENFDYIKNNLLVDISYICEESAHYDWEVIALSELYSKSPAKFFETFFSIYPNPAGYGNVLNVRWISLGKLTEMRNIFHKGWLQLHENSKLYAIYKSNITNLGLFLGSIDVFQEIEEKVDDSEFDEILESYSEHAMVYNILPLYDGKYLFIILEGEFNGWENSNFSLQATGAFFYILDSNNHISIKPITIDGIHFQIPLAMDKLFFVLKSENSHKCLIAHILGTDNHLTLSFLDVKTNSLSSLSIDEDVNYHCSNFAFNTKDQHSNWGFEINNELDPNILPKVSGKVDAWLDFNNQTITTQVSYVDPALQLYTEERNEELIFPLANLNRLGGREIKDDVLLRLIRDNCKPYYHYSAIQESFSYMAEMHPADLSGLGITYLSDESTITSEASYFFLVKRRGEGLQILGLYKITDNGLKDVYKSSFLNKLFGQ